MEQPNFVDLTDYSDIKETFPFPNKSVNDVKPEDFGKELEDSYEDREDLKKAA